MATTPHSPSPSRSLRRRYIGGYIFVLCTALATALTVLCLGFVIVTLLKSSSGAFWRTQIAVPAQASLEPVSALLTPYAQHELQAAPKEGGVAWLTASTPVAEWVKTGVLPHTLMHHAPLLKELQHEHRVREVFNWNFFTASDSREPELAGIFGSMMGSLYTLATALIIAFPLGVATAIYLEEFSSHNWLTRLVELNIQNLAAVPSIIFGVLGITIFIQVLHLPRSSALVGGLTLALMAVPLIVTTTRQALSSIPRSTREAVIALGATRVQLVYDHLLPLAFPTIITGTILAICRIIGETAPLLLIGMVAFITVPPRHFLDPATALPVQIYLWAETPEPGFISNTSAAILVLILFLLLMNTVAILLRKRYTSPML